jgi:glycosyltransferase involved in cell wall biosynthesis
MASHGSSRYGGRLFVHKPPTSSLTSRVYRKIRFQLLALRAAKDADVVICFGRADYLRALYATRIPIIIRFANPVDQHMIDQVLQYRQEHIRFVGISHDQVADVRRDPRMHIIHNAVDLTQFAFQAQASSPPYLAFLGRLTQNKGIRQAIDVAKQVGIPLRIAGNIADSEPGAREYFDAEIKPQLGSDIEWIGPVNDLAKQKLLGGAKALLFPIQWREPFGIVMAEALACGCPVIAWRNGSVPEVVRNGHTGFVIESMAEMVEAIKKIDSIDRSVCRQDAEQRFSEESMVTRYLEILQAMCGSLTL